MESPLWDGKRGTFDKEFTLENMKIRYMFSSLMVAGPHKGNESFTFENATHESLS